MNTVIEFLKKHKWPVAVVLALLLGLAGGRFTTTPQVVEKVKTVTVTKTVEVEKKQTQTEVDQHKDVTKDQRVHRVVVETKKPDGTVTKTTTEDINTDASKHEQVQETKIQYVDREVIKWQERIVEKEKTVMKQPNWEVFAGVGVDIPYFLGQGQHGIPGLDGFVVTAGAGRRLFGPLWFDAYGNTEAQVGVMLKVQW